MFPTKTIPLSLVVTLDLFADKALSIRGKLLVLENDVVLLAVLKEVVDDIGLMGFV